MAQLGMHYILLLHFIVIGQYWAFNCTYLTKYITMLWCRN